MADTDEPANLPGIRKGTTTFTGLHPYRPGPKSGDRFFLDKGDGKILEHIAENVTYDRHGGFTFTPRPVTREDGPRTPGASEAGAGDAEKSTQAEDAGVGGSGVEEGGRWVRRLSRLAFARSPRTRW